MFCPSCGAEVPDDSTFCSNCGAKIDASPPISTEKSIGTRHITIKTMPKGNVEISTSNAEMPSETSSTLPDPTPSVPSTTAPSGTSKPWYRSAGCLVLAFIFFTPAWSVLILTDKEAKSWVKAVAAILLVLQITCCLLYFAIYFRNVISSPQGY